MVFSGRKLSAVQHYNGVVTVEFCNEKMQNALDEEMAAEALQLYKQLKAFKPRAIVFRGRGEIFSAGGDLNLMASMTERSRTRNRNFLYGFYSSFIKLARYPAPTIAHINGHAVGAGFCFALACDMRMVVSYAKVGLNFVKLGISPGMGAEFWLKNIPGNIASEMIMTGRIYKASDLESYNVYNYCGGKYYIENRVKEISDQIAANSRTAIAKSLPLIRNNNLSLEQMLRAEANAQADCFAGGHVSDAIKALKNKRAYRFKD